MEFIKRYLLSMNQRMETDPTLLECCKKLFEFANDIGLKGTKVKDLEFKEERFNGWDVLPSAFFCMQEVKENSDEKDNSDI